MLTVFYLTNMATALVTIEHVTMYLIAKYKCNKLEK